MDNRRAQDKAGYEIGVARLIKPLVTCTVAKSAQGNTIWLRQWCYKISVFTFLSSLRLKRKKQVSC